MAQFSPALEFVLNNEDRNREYAVVPDADVRIKQPDGSVAIVKTEAIAGINSHSWPTAFSNIARMPQEQRAAAVANFYLVEFWNVMRLGGINSQDLANRVLDEGVNAGPYTSCRMLQGAVNVFLARKLQVDGILGAQSLKAVNCADEVNLLTMFRSLRTQRYQNIAAANPADAKYLPAWEARARA